MKPISLLASGAFLAVGFATTARAQSAPAAPATLFACYVPSSGTVYRISPDGSIPDLKKDCTGTSHVKFSWSEQGPQGPKGDAGPQGPAGPPGPPSTASGYEVVNVDHAVAAQSAHTTYAAACPTGKVAISGGYKITSTTAAFPNINPGGNSQGITGMNPSVDGSAWEVRFNNQSTFTWSISVFAVCLTR